jgi:hypothetical protein
MNPTRRDIFRAGALGVVAAGFGACDGAASKTSVEMGGRQIPEATIASESYGFSLATFSPHVGSRFQLADANGARADLTLVAATNLGIAGRPVVDKAECFALAFEAADHAVLGQNTYLASHTALGSFPLFVVPGAPSSTGQRYSALFNRL